MIVETASGSTYVVDGTRVMRTTSDGVLRRDGEWVDLVSRSEPTVGEPMVMVIVGLAEDSPTVSATSPVVSII